MTSFVGVIKNKLKQYMQTQDITLATLFKLIDTNSDQQLSISEFKQKMKALQTPLDDSELQMLFQHLDKTKRGTIDYQLFVEEFPEINGKPLSCLSTPSVLHGQEDQGHPRGKQGVSGDSLQRLLH